jgi:hypothetical protein
MTPALCAFTMTPVPFWDVPIGDDALSGFATLCDVEMTLALRL